MRLKLIFFISGLPQRHLQHHQQRHVLQEHQQNHQGVQCSVSRFGKVESVFRRLDLLDMFSDSLMI